jgi:hypothetical protein
MDSLQFKVFPEKGESYLMKKKAEKLGDKKGYTEFRGIDASTPAQAAKPVAQTQLREIAKSQLLKTSHPTLDALIDRLVKANVHKITSSTNIVLNDATGLFQTPLGIVGPDAIRDARDILADTIPFVQNGRYGKPLDRLVSQYLRLIPQDIGMKFDVRMILPDMAAIQKQGDLLDALDASCKTIFQAKPVANTTTQAEQVFQVDLDVETGNEASRLEEWFEKSKKSSHGYDRIKIRNIFKVKIHDMERAFVGGNITEVFHGTSEANCLSILKSGLQTSPPSTARIAGKMWGNGIYGAINSSKSLGYTYGKWGQTTGESGWLIICKFAMGKIYYPTNRCNQPASGYDSVWARAKETGLYHDELIVYSNNRATATHLLECK